MSSTISLVSSSRASQAAPLAASKELQLSINAIYAETGACLLGALLAPLAVVVLCALSAYKSAVGYLRTELGWL